MCLMFVFCKLLLHSAIEQFKDCTTYTYTFAEDEKRVQKRVRRAGGGGGEHIGERKSCMELYVQAELGPGQWPGIRDKDRCSQQSHDVSVSLFSLIWYQGWENTMLWKGCLRKITNRRITDSWIFRILSWSFINGLHDPLERYDYL